MLDDRLSLARNKSLSGRQMDLRVVGDITRCFAPRARVWNVFVVVADVWRLCLVIRYGDGREMVTASYARLFDWSRLYNSEMQLPQPFSSLRGA
jgi:hypothetical protein